MYLEAYLRRASGVMHSGATCVTKRKNSFLTYGGNGVRHMGKRGGVGELKKRNPFSSDKKGINF